MLGNVKLPPLIPKNSQDYIQKERKTDPKPVDFVLHVGSESTAEEIAETVSYYVIKIDIDTDLQWAFWDDIRNVLPG